MANGLELLERYIEQKNEAVEAFITDANRIKKAIEKGTVKGRSPVKLEGDTFYKFTLVGRPMKIDGKDNALQHIGELISAAYDENDTEFRAVIEEAYGSPVEEEQPKKRGRKPKTVQTGQDNGIDRSID